MRFFLLSILFLAFAFGGIETHFLKADRRFNIDYRILEAIAEIESGKNPYAIGLVTSKWRGKRIINFLAKEGIDYSFDAFGNKSLHISINPVTYHQAIKALRYIKKFGVRNYDVGLMQINKVNIKSFAEEKALLKDIFYNVYKGASILRNCFDRYRRSVAKTIECYNKGFDIRGRRDYFKKFLLAYKRLRGY